VGAVKPTATIGGPNATIDDAQLGVEDFAGPQLYNRGQPGSGRHIFAVIDACSRLIWRSACKAVICGVAVSWIVVVAFTAMSSTPDEANALMRKQAVIFGPHGENVAPLIAPPRFILGLDTRPMTYAQYEASTVTSARIVLRVTLFSILLAFFVTLAFELADRSWYQRA